MIITFHIFYKRKIRGHLNFVYNYKNEKNEGIITYMEIDKDFRGLGLGTFLLNYLYNFVIENYKDIKKIIFDDCSDHFRSHNNIYKKVGATYLYEEGPEMIWIVDGYKKEKKYKYKIITNYN